MNRSRADDASLPGILQEGHVTIFDLAEDERRRLAGREVCSNRCNHSACQLASTGEADEVVQNHGDLVRTPCSSPTAQSNPVSNAAEDSQACSNARGPKPCVAATPNATMRASVCRQHADDTLTESPFRHRRRSDTDAVLLLNLTSNWTRVIDLGFQSYSVNARPAQMLPLTCHPACVPIL